MDPIQAILVEESVKDVQTAAAVGMPAIMVLSGLGRNSDLESMPLTCRLALDLAHAAQLILNGESSLSCCAKRGISSESGLSS